MTKAKVLKLIGSPESIVPLGVDNGSDSLTIWNYGKQNVSFTGNKVNGITVDQEKQNELMKQYEKGEITMKEVKNRLDVINKEECK